MPPSSLPKGVPPLTPKPLPEYLSSAYEAAIHQLGQEDSLKADGAVALGNLEEALSSLKILQTSRYPKSRLLVKLLKHPGLLTATTDIQILNWYVSLTHTLTDQDLTYLFSQWDEETKQRHLIRWGRISRINFAGDANRLFQEALVETTFTYKWSDDFRDIIIGQRFSSKSPFIQGLLQLVHNPGERKINSNLILNSLSYLSDLSKENYLAILNFPARSEISQASIDRIFQKTSHIPEVRAHIIKNFARSLRIQDMLNTPSFPGLDEEYGLFRDYIRERVKGAGLGTWLETKSTVILTAWLMTFEDEPALFIPDSTTKDPLSTMARGLEILTQRLGHVPRELLALLLQARQKPMRELAIKYTRRPAAQSI